MIIIHCHKEESKKVKIEFQAILDRIKEKIIS